MDLLNLFSSFKHIIYYDEEHIYMNKSTNIKYTSSTGVVKKYTGEFDTEYWVRYKTLKNKGFSIKPKTNINILNALIVRNDLVQEVELLRQEWKDKATKASNEGSGVHEYMSHAVFNKQGIKTVNIGNEGKIKAANKFLADSPHLTAIASEFVVGTSGTEEDTIRIAGMIDLIAFNSNTNSIELYDYKGLPLDTPLLTTKGFKLMNNISVGDIVFDKDGNEAPVLHVSEIHHNPCFKINFKNGDSIIADHEHKWVVKHRTKGGRDAIKTLTTEELFNSHKSTTVYKIENHKKLSLKHTDLPIPPYILGIWLADGNRGSGSITQHKDSKIWEAIQKEEVELGEVHKTKRESNAVARNLKGLLGKLTALNVYKNKHIPEIYFQASHEQRLDLLRGYMDGDGWYNKSRKRYGMDTTNFIQANDVKRLVQSLGITSSIQQFNTNTNFKQNVLVYRVQFTSSFSPFKCRHQDIKLKASYQSKVRYIESVEKVESVATKCIAVDSPSKTYLAGIELIPTHNTNAKLDLTNPYEKMKPPYNNLQASTYNKFRLQLSIYKYLLESKGVAVSAINIVHLKEDGTYKIYNLKPIKNLHFNDNTQLNLFN